MGSWATGEDECASRHRAEPEAARETERGSGGQTREGECSGRTIQEWRNTFPLTSDSDHKHTLSCMDAIMVV